jgi:predicted metal-dependent hydrolase
LLIKKMYSLETTPYIKQRFEYWEKTMNLKAKLLFKWMKSKWGVCDVMHKQITLSLQLASYDKNVIDYVIVHELAHLVHPNHSSKFWAYVSQYMPNWKQLRNTINLR